MDREGCELITAHSLEQAGREALVAIEGAIQVFAFGDLVKQLSDRVGGRFQSDAGA